MALLPDSDFLHIPRLVRGKSKRRHRSPGPDVLILLTAGISLLTAGTGVLILSQIASQHPSGTKLYVLGVVLFIGGPLRRRCGRVQARQRTGSLSSSSPRPAS